MVCVVVMFALGATNWVLVTHNMPLGRSETEAILPTSCGTPVLGVWIMRNLRELCEVD